MDDKEVEFMRDLKEALVETHGPCRGTGVFPSTDGFVNRCDCLKVLRWVRALRQADIPQRYWTLSLGDLKVPQETKNLVSLYTARLPAAVKKAMGIMLAGPNGVGKTSLACEIGKAAIIYGYKVRYLTAYQYLRSMMETRIDLKPYDVILLDEVEKVYVKAGSDYAQVTVENLLRDYMPSKAMVCCTNMTEAELKEKLGRSTVSLLKRSTKFEWMEGGDYGEVIQKDWLGTLDTEFDYMDREMVNSAQAYDIQELQKERLAWVRNPE